MTTTLVPIDTSKLRHELRVRAITHTELADRAGITQRTVERILSRGACSPRSLDGIACGLGIHPTELEG